MKKKKRRKRTYNHTLEFSAALPTLDPTQKTELLHWLRARRRARRNGHPARTFYLITPTGERRRIT
jgi:hypothetical protein